MRSLRIVLLSTVTVVTAACASTVLAVAATAQGVAASPPRAAPARWRSLIGEYGTDTDTSIVLERDGRLWVHTSQAEHALKETSADVFVNAESSSPEYRVRFLRSGSHVTGAVIDGAQLTRRQVGPESGNQLLVPPIRPIPELRREALAATPPAEPGPFRKTDLVELKSLDPTIKLEIRYATSNNLFGTPFYSEARAFLQRPAAEAVVRANKTLRASGYGLLIHDGYRPWYVTKMFWDASPDDKHIFVANPAEGSRHNRGAAVDLSLYDLKSGAPADMVSTYDETSSRAYPNYVGGTSLQRWRRDLLRSAMEGQRFTVYEAEWWHFDYADWREYGIGNLEFSKIK